MHIIIKKKKPHFFFSEFIASSVAKSNKVQKADIFNKNFCFGHSALAASSLSCSSAEDIKAQSKAHRDTLFTHQNKVQKVVIFNKHFCFGHPALAVH